MTEDQRDLLEAARGSLTAARILLQNGYAGFAASRAYYTMFYVAEAFLEGQEMSFSKHSAVIAAFGREFAHAGKVPQEFHRFLLEGQQLRHEGDYGPSGAVTEEAARQQIDRAEEFLRIAEQGIGGPPGETG